MRLSLTYSSFSSNLSIYWHDVIVMRSPRLRRSRIYSFSRHLHVKSNHFRLFYLIAIMTTAASGVGALTIYNSSLNTRYALSRATVAITGAIAPGLNPKLALDTSQKTIWFNQQALHLGNSNPGASLAASIGSNTRRDTPLYSAQLPEAANVPITYYDNNLNLSFQFSAQFARRSGRIVDGHIIYPVDSIAGAQDVFTPKNNGLKEDLVLNRPTNRTLSYSYKLRLPMTLTARMLPDNSGGIGIYSADKALFNKISFGSTLDQASIERARQSSAKNNLVFVIPPPTIKSSRGRALPRTALPAAHFTLQENTVTVTVNSLSLDPNAYPISIDPSVVISGTSGFAAGFSDSDITFNGSGISRGSLTGGDLKASWNSSAGGTANSDYNATSVINNGYIYEIGGCDSTGCPSTHVYFALQCTGANFNVSGCGAAAGTVGSWQSTTSLPVATRNATSVVYNNFLYEIGGFNSTYSSTVYFAPINGDGTLGAWSTTTALPAARELASAVVSNGFVYEMGGDQAGAAPAATVYSAPLNGNGTLGAWSTTTVLPTALNFASSIVSNGYVYEIGGVNSSSTKVATVTKALICTGLNSGVGGCGAVAGKLGTWVATTALPAVYSESAAVVDNGYVYVVGGCSTLCPTNVVYFALICTGANAGTGGCSASVGDIGTWSSTSSLVFKTWDHTAIASNGYLFIIGGYTTTPIPNVYSAAFFGSGGVNSWYNTTYLGKTNLFSLPTSNLEGATAAYNGFMYLLGGQIHNGQGSSINADVYFAPINSDGTLGTWTTTTSLPTPTVDHTALAYNGYLYLIGGYTPSTSNTTSNVFRATINANGSIGVWTATASLPVATGRAATTIYGNHMYSFGGYTTAASPNVYVTTINADGSLGTWSSLTSLPSNAQNTTAAAYNGFVYVIGGYVGTGNTGAVYSAAVNTDGTLGTWNTVSSLNNGTDTASSVVANGYLYEFGGFTTTTDSYVEYAPINADGSLGAWVSTTPLPLGTHYATAQYYNGNAYFLGGVSPANTNDNVIYYTSFQPAGWLTTPNLPNTPTALTTGIQQGASAASNGYIYQIGGNVNPGKTAAVSYAQVTADGGLGAWATTTSLPVATQDNSAVIYNGYLYEIGGFTTAATANAYYALICTGSNNGVGGCTATAGTIGTWNATTSLPTATYGAGAVVYSGQLYFVGGYTTSATAAVYRTTIGANGTLGAWSATTSLPTASRNAGVVVSGGYVYVVGGYNGAASSTAVYYSQIAASGALGAWTTGPSLPVGTADASAVVVNGFIYILGGFTTNTVADVYYIPINANGSLGSWAVNTPLPFIYQYASAVFSNGYIYDIGGTDGSTLSLPDITAFRVNNGGGGQLAAFVTAATSLPTATYSAAVVADHGYVYEMGGHTTTTVATVSYASLKPDGTIGAWSAATSLPVALEGASAVVMNDIIYLIGGYNSSLAPVATVYYAHICNGNNSGVAGCTSTPGTLGTWLSGTSLPTATAIGSTATFNGYLYLLGGFTATWTATVDYAPINSDGTLGAWTATTSLPAALASNSVFANGNFIYSVGGVNNGVYTSAVYTAPLNPNGTVGTWTATSSALPVPLAGSSAVNYDGFVYVLGGLNTGGTLKSGYFTTVSSGGLLSPWVNTPSLPAAISAAGSAASGGHIYILGGKNGAGAAVSPSYYASADVLARIGRYSQIINLGALRTLTNESYVGTIASGAGSLSYNAAGANAIFGGNKNPRDLAAQATICVGGVTNYVYLQLILDDSYSASYPDVAGFTSSLSSLTATYSAGYRPPPQTRLRMGQSFVSEIIQPFDTCGP